MTNFRPDEIYLELKYFELNQLKPAPDNGLLYDTFAPLEDEDDEKLSASIEEEGVLEPLHISADGYILSGHRRYAAAKWQGLGKVPCLVSQNIMFDLLSSHERLNVLALYNKQRDKSHAEKLREAMQEINPNMAYYNLRADRLERSQIKIEDNVSLGKVKKRARIMTATFLEAAIKAVNSERQYWPLTVRRVHYLLLNFPPLTHDKKPGSTYQNKKADYNKLTNLLLRARLTGAIPHQSIDDETRPIRVLKTYQNPADYIKEETKDFLTHYGRDILRGQKNHIEILVEKNALRKHVELVADEYCIPCTTGRGYSSLTPRYRMYNRFNWSGKEKLILLILSDFDPDGEEIAASFPRSLRDDFGLTNVLAHKVMLSGDDVKKYNLPSDMKAKKSSPNYKKFVQKHGTHAAELDAAPIDLIQSRLREAIEDCLDMELFQAEIEQEKKDYAFISATKRIIVKSMGC